MATPIGRTQIGSADSMKLAPDQARAVSSPSYPRCHCRVWRHGIADPFAPFGIREAFQFELLLRVHEALQRRKLEGREGTVPGAVLAADDGHQTVLGGREARWGVVFRGMGLSGVRNAPTAVVCHSRRRC